MVSMWRHQGGSGKHGYQCYSSGRDVGVAGRDLPDQDLYGQGLAKELAVEKTIFYAVLAMRSPCLGHWS